MSVGHRRRATATIVLGLLLLRAVTAGAITFGADLTGPADNTGSCSLLFSNSCMFYSGAQGPGFYAPLSGTVTAVRVKTGNFQQGPMQIVVMRSLYQNNLGDPGHPYFACCFVEQYGPVFTPQPNSVTTVPTSLPMVEDPIPPPNDGIDNARGDFLALSILAPNVPIPATSDPNAVYSGYAPAPDPQNTPAPSPNPIFASVSGFGYHMAMSADLSPGGGGPGALPVTIATGGQLLGTTAAIPVTCVLTNACRGVLRLGGVPAQARAAVRPAAKLRAYGKRRFVIQPGATLAISVKLNKAARRALGDVSSVTVVATARVRSHAVTTQVQLVR